MRALYRRYRPLRLEDVVGQEQATAPLGNALKNGKVSHAYLFVGPRGCGKTSVARILAHEVNNFKYELEDSYVDIIEIDGASNRGIDNIRELREKVAIAPTMGKYKVYIIDEVHMLTKEAFNALLKTLEEPPAHVIFIMATTDAHKVPVTITSRAQTYTFKLVDTDVIFQHLKEICEKEKINITDEALMVVAKRGEGSFRDSISLLDQISTLSDKEITKELVVSALGLPEDEKINELLECYADGDVVKITTILKGLLGGGVKPETLVDELIRAIIAEPKAELMELLGKLPEVRAPYAEAKLLVALLKEAPVESSSGALLGGAPVESSSGARSSGPSPRADAAKPRAAALRTPLRKDSTGANANSFDWDKFVEQVRAMDNGVAGMLANVKHTETESELEIYPDKSFIEKTLTKDKNKAVLISCAGGLKVTIHSYADFQNLNNLNKDALISKMSAIMGGEVQNDGGGNNPF